MNTNKNTEESKRVGKAVKAKKQQCYNNAMRVIWYVPEYDKADYVEGYAVINGDFCIEHGWVEQDGVAIDPTLPHDDIAYFPGLSNRGTLMRQCIIALVPILAISQFTFAKEPIRERIEWADIWVTNADKDDLPRVLLIGDSITRGYFDAVEKQLEGKAYCARLATSTCVADPAFLDEVLLLLKQYRFAVIHFNNGLHGFGYTEEQYRNGLVGFMATFQKHAPDAKLIWASSTPIRKRENLHEFSDGTERVQARNKIAAEIMKERGVPVDDLYGLVEQHPDWFSGDGVHFNEKGREVEAKQVAEAILSCLSAPATTPK